MKSQFLPICIFIFLGLEFIKASSIGSAQYNHSHHHHDDMTETETLKCYSCISIENFPNMTADGCGKLRPPTEYLTEDCFAFNNPSALAAIRHESENPGSILDPQNVHCVHIKGSNDVGGAINVRGCVILPKEDVFQTKTCMTKEDFLFLPIGFVKNVEYCYCKGIAGCNDTTKLQFETISLLLVLLISAVNNFV